MSRKKHGNAKTHLPCEIEGCANLQQALGLCRSHYKKQYRLLNHDKIKEQERIRGLSNRENRLLSLEKFRYSVKGRYGYMRRDAPRRGLICTITLSEYTALIAKSCYYCESPMPESMGTGLDRIDNKKGYELDNVLTCCGDCNSLRMDKLTVAETKHLAMALKEFRRE